MSVLCVPTCKHLNDSLTFPEKREPEMTISRVPGRPEGADCAWNDLAHCHHAWVGHSIPDTTPETPPDTQRPPHH